MPKVSRLLGRWVQRPHSEDARQRQKPQSFKIREDELEIAVVVAGRIKWPQYYSREINQKPWLICLAWELWGDMSYCRFLSIVHISRTASNAA